MLTGGAYMVIERLQFLRATVRRGRIWLGWPVNGHRFREETPCRSVLDIKVTPLSPACGAEISGIDLTRPLSRDNVEAIKEA
jgi:hypothetical protein